MMEMSLLSCPLCLKPHFQGVDALRSSLINVATTHISCPVCSELLLGLDKLTIHLFSHISGSKVSQDNSSQTNIRNEVENEKQTISESNLNQNAFNVIEDIEMRENNIESTTEEKIQNVTCDICNFHFSDENILDLHQKLLHQTSPDKKSGKYNYHCHLCNKQFKMRGSLMVHLRVAHFGYVQSNHHRNSVNYKEESNNVKLLSSNENVQNTSDKEEPQILLMLSPNTPSEKRKVLNAAPKSQENKQWECEVCLKLFTTKYFLKKHKRLHTGEMPYYCSQCNKYFTFQQSYHKHMLYHSDDKPHICSECGRAFKELSTLHNHERIHSGERPFSCETCGKCFRQRVSYLVHRRIHTGVMPYKCTACNKTFRYKVSQRSHKCPVNPPGCVVRTPDLVEKLIQNHKDKNSTKTTDQNVVKTQEQITELHINSDNRNSIKQNLPIEVKDVINMNAVQENFGFVEQNLHLDMQDSTSLNVVQDYLQDNSFIDKMHQDDNTGSTAGQEDAHKFSSYYNDNTCTTKEDATVSFTSSDAGNPDFFALILSPVLSDVQSLCLSNYTDAQNNSKKENKVTISDADTLQTINEESFKELLYGPNSKIE